MAPRVRNSKDFRDHTKGRFRGGYGAADGAERQAGLDVTQRGYVIESGLITLAAASATLINDPHVRQAYLGELGRLCEAA